MLHLIFWLPSSLRVKADSEHIHDQGKIHNGDEGSILTLSTVGG